MQVGQKQSKDFRIFLKNYQKKKDANKADAILIASFYNETHKIDS